MNAPTAEAPPSRAFSRSLKIAALMSVLIPAAAARADFQTSYTFTLDADMPEVTNILMYESGDLFQSVTWPFEAPGYGETTELVNPFPHRSLPTQGLLIGLIKGLPTDGSPEQEHVVLFMDDTAAQLAAGIAWGTLFRNTLEEQLIAAIKLATSGEDQPSVDPGFEIVNDFAYGDATDGILGPGGGSYSAWFELGDSFTVMSWSDGAIIGTGTSQVTPLAAPIPEPSSLALAGLGALGLLGFASRRRRAA